MRSNLFLLPPPRVWCCVILTIELHAGLDAWETSRVEWHAHFSLRVMPVAARWSTWPRSRVYRSRLQTKLCTGNGTVYLLCSALMDGPYGWRLPLANKILARFLNRPQTLPGVIVHYIGLLRRMSVLYYYLFIPPPPLRPIEIAFLQDTTNPSSTLSAVKKKSTSFTCHFSTFLLNIYNILTKKESVSVSIQENIFYRKKGITAVNRLTV